MKPLDGKTILITGGAGFSGSHLVSTLATDYSCELHIFGNERPTVNTNHPLATSNFHPVDITNREQVNTQVKTICPDIVYHLAAQSNVHDSFKHPDVTWNVNLSGTLNMLEAVSTHAPDAVFINVGSSDMYGRSFLTDSAVTEDSLLRPVNPYAASKAAADLAAYQYAATTRLKIIRARPFNHSGAGQSKNFVLPAFACQVAEIEAGIRPPILQTGDLTPERDFLHINDVVSAYILLAAHSETITSGQAFNIASGQACKISTLLDKLIAKSTAEIVLEQDPARLRPTEIRHVQGDYHSLKTATGWQPKLSIDNLLDDLLDFWREQIQAAH